MPSLKTILPLLLHPAELRAVVNYKIWHDKRRDITDPKEFETSRYDQPAMRKCWDYLDMTSRSFAAVIRELDGELARVVCIFYLVLRALDTVEDDMTIPNSTKLPLLRSMHLKLHEPGWTFSESKEKDRIVLENFTDIQSEFALLEQKYQDVISDICRKMGAGMADFAALATPEHPVAEVQTIEDYDLYCHYVAGLVGEGLSGLFAASGRERSWLSSQLTLSNSMGLLLQKTNILRDIREDVLEGRGFWPREIWQAHGFNSMKELIDPTREKEAMLAASQMILDAMRHACDALDYLTLLKNQSVFNFVAIPAVMAIATLDRCYMNPLLLKQNVKIRRGEAVRIITRSVNPRDVAYIFRDYARSIHQKISLEDPNLVKVSIACAKIEQWTEHHYPSFLQITGVSGNAQTAFDQMSKDARVGMYQNLAKALQEKAAKEKREALIADLKARGILKERSPEEEAELERKRIEAANEPFPWLLVLGVVGGVIATMAALAGIVVWVLLKYGGDE